MLGTVGFKNFVFRFSQIKTAAAVMAVAFAALSGRSAEVAAPVWLAGTWQTDEGLPDNNVTGVAQTQDGYLWVSTPGGLRRFNGQRFEEFPLLHLPDVANHVVRKMFLDRGGRLWLVMDRGSIICAGKDGARVYTQADGLQYTRVTTMADDREGAMWLACGSTIYRILEGKVSRFGPEEGLPEGNYTWVATDEQGTLWFVRGAHLGVFRAGIWKTLLTLEQTPLKVAAARGGGIWISTATQVLRFREGSAPQPRGTLPEKAAVSAMLEDEDGALWIGTDSDGLLRLQGGVMERVATLHPEILCMTEDREKNLWVGTGGGGLNMLHAQATHLVGKKEGLPGEAVRSVCQLADGELWAAMNNGALGRGRGGEWSAVTAADGWPGSNAMCVASAHEGGVWIGTRGQGLQLLRAGKLTEWGREAGLGSMSVRSLLESSQGDLWIATDRPSQLLRYRAGKFEALDMPPEVRSLRALVEGVDGTIWAGSSDGHLLRVHGNVLVGEPAVHEDRAMSIRSVYAGADGSVWIGYAGWGLGRLWNGHYMRVTTKEGLHDDYVSQIMADDGGGLWLNSNHGLFEVRQEELVAVMEGRAQRVRSTVFGKNEGLLSIQPTWDNSPAACRTAEGHLWFATRNGLLAVQPKQIQENPAPPPVVLEQVSVDDRVVGLQDARSPLRGLTYTNCVDLKGGSEVLPLSAGHRKVEFEFAALSFTSPENVHFRYRLQNFDNEWVDLDAEAPQTAKYPQLPPGKYEFQVSACNNSGVWNEQGFRLNLAVAPFFWQTWWFRIGVLVGFTLSVVGLVRYFSFRRLRHRLASLEQQAALQRERTRIARDMHDEVGSKLSRLSLLSDMVSHEPEMPAAARGEVAEISETARDTIRSFEEIVWAVNPKNDSLPNLVNYLCRFAEDFFEGSETQCVFDMPGEIPAIELPTGARHHLFLAAKEALNNVFKHSRAKKVCVRLRIVEEGFEIEIADDGVGLKSDGNRSRGGSGSGMDNMRERMKQAGGEFELRTHPEAGTIVVLRLPCKHVPAV